MIFHALNPFGLKNKIKEESIIADGVPSIVRWVGIDIWGAIDTPLGAERPAAPKKNKEKIEIEMPNLK